MKKQHLLCISLFFVFPTILLSQSPWTKNKNEFYTQLGFSTIPKYEGVFGDPNYFTAREITDNTLQLYAEYGVSNKTTLLLNVPFKNIKTGDLTNKLDANIAIPNAKTINAFGDIELGIKHNFYTKKWLVTGQFNLTLNTSSYNKPSGIRTGYNAFGFTPLITAGRGFKKTYFQAFTGFNINTNHYSTNFKIGGEFGAKIVNKIWLAGFLDFVISLNNGNFKAPLENTLTALYVNNQEYTAFGLKAIGKITPKFGVIAGFGGAFSGNNVAEKAALNFAIYFKTSD